MMMKKKLMAWLAVGALTLGTLVAGCGSDKTAQKAAAPKMDKVSITYVQAPLNVPSIVEKSQPEL
jgi:sulfonate transport system substrate-binding protein